MPVSALKRCIEVLVVQIFVIDVRAKEMGVAIIFSLEHSGGCNRKLVFFDGVWILIQASVVGMREGYRADEEETENHRDGSSDGQDEEEFGGISREYDVCYS